MSRLMLTARSAPTPKSFGGSIKVDLVDYQIDFDPEPTEGDIQVVAAGVTVPAETGTTASAYTPFAFFIRDADKKVVGGIVGNTGGPWVYISALWVTERLRGRGLGSRLLNRAEQLGSQRGCAGSYLDTLSADALAFYEARGYELFGRLDGFVDGGVRSFLRKNLSRNP